MRVWALAGIVADSERTFAILRGLEADVFLAPHPFVFGMAEKRAQMEQGGHNPFVDPQELRRFVDRSEPDFRAALAREQTRK